MSQSFEAIEILIDEAYHTKKPWQGFSSSISQKFWFCGLVHPPFLSWPSSSEKSSLSSFVYIQSRSKLIGCDEVIHPEVLAMSDRPARFVTSTYLYRQSQTSFFKIFCEKQVESVARRNIQWIGPRNCLAMEWSMMAIVEGEFPNLRLPSNIT
jgi:hypothetical protein